MDAYQWHFQSTSIDADGDPNLKNHCCRSRCRRGIKHTSYVFDRRQKVDVDLIADHRHLEQPGVRFDLGFSKAGGTSKSTGTTRIIYDEDFEVGPRQVQSTVAALETI